MTACCSIFVVPDFFLVSNGSRRKGGVSAERVLHHVAACYSSLHCIAGCITMCRSQEVGLRSGNIRGCVLQHIAVCCRLCASAVQRVAVCVVV